MKQKILIIEDDSVFQKAVSRALEERGFEVFSAIEGESGLRIVEKERPDLIVLDIVVPKKDGFEVMQFLSSHPEFSSIPVIIVTNLEGSQDVERMLSLGAKAFLVKANYTLEEIVDAIMRALESVAPKRK